MVHLDTHAVVWLVSGDLHRFPSRVRSHLRNDALWISPMAALELEYLHEIGRLKLPAHVVLNELHDKLGLRLTELSFPQIAQRAWALTWTRDPFDRLIAATAMAADVPLLTADTTLLEHCPVAVWE